MLSVCQIPENNQQILLRIRSTYYASLQTLLQVDFDAVRLRGGNWCESGAESFLLAKYSSSKFKKLYILIRLLLRILQQKCISRLRL
jgi:hypothetical protein